MCELNHIRMAQSEREYIALRWKELHGEQLSPEIPTDLAAQVVSICDTLDDCTRMVNETNTVLRQQGVELRNEIAACNAATQDAIDAMRQAREAMP